MFIKRVSPENQEIIVSIPLTTTSGKIRIKERDNIYGYGLPFASRSNKFNQRNYIEWQIGYDIEVVSDKIKLTTLKNLNFTAYNTKKKALYELSEYLYYLATFNIIKINELESLKNFIKNLEENNLISKHPHCAIKRTHPVGEKINDLDFEILKIEYPQLIHKFKHYEVITEITIREKQRAVGVQPMLYFCFPITELISDTHLIGRCANLKEFADFKINKDNSFIIVEMIKIFGMLSPSHKHDTIEIMDLVIKSL
ncbi:MAG: R.Pab1 family restriction endonuclease [Rickettsiales bacterium]|nr:R.Pab1 family restriction endonuclease [Rickettsiales bacterium]